MKQVIITNKQSGETPLECIYRFKRTYPEYQAVKMTYAGRLDPLASGVMILLAGEKVHEKESFTNLEKTYICKALIGISTDTYDIIGIPNVHKNITSFDLMQKHLESFLGTFEQEYPPYSSKTLGGKQLHQLAKIGELEGKILPKRWVEVIEVGGIDVREISRSEISRHVTKSLSCITGDFRQETILKAWESLLEKTAKEPFHVVTFTIHVSSGTYIRGIVHELGKKLGTGACIFELHRIAVGPYIISPES